MKQRTFWSFVRTGNQKTFIRAGLVHNINDKYKKFNIVRLQLKSTTREADLFMRPDEAIQMIYGLSNVLERWFEDQPKKVKG